jgi:hypothetical protein
MDKYIELLDKMAKEHKCIYSLQLIHVDTWDITNIDTKNTTCVKVDDHKELNGTYDNVMELRKKAAKYYLDIGGGEIYTDTRGWDGGSTVGHYRYFIEK